jgi:hypothetical protein
MEAKGQKKCLMIALFECFKIGLTHAGFIVEIQRAKG